MKMRHCRSCGMPLTDPEAIIQGEYCLYCTDTSGQLKPREDIKNGIAFWLQEWSPPAEPDVFIRRAESYMAAMPEWAEE